MRLEKPIDKVITAILSAGFVGVLVVAGLDARFGWSRAPADQGGEYTRACTNSQPLSR